MKRSIIFAIISIVASVASLTATSQNSGTPLKRFSWGIDAGSSIDMTGHDMSAIDISACFGYSGPGLRLAGLGTGVNMMISNGSNSYPIYAVLRTDFKRTPQLCFMDAKAGIALTTIAGTSQQTTPYGSLGVGITLAKGKSFCSHIILSYNYTQLDDQAVDEDGTMMRIHDLQSITIGIGVTF